MNTNLKILDDANFNNEVLAATDVVIVDFWAPWCGPCNLMLPVLESIAETLKVCKVNIDENPSLAIQYNIGAIPTLLFFKGGEMVRRLVGVHTKDAIVTEATRFQNATVVAEGQVG